MAPKLISMTYQQTPSLSDPAVNKKMNFIFRTVDPEYASVAGMFGAASIVTGIFSGIGFSYLMPLIVSHHALHFGAPYWWPSYVN